MNFEFVHFFPRMRAVPVHRGLVNWFTNQEGKITLDQPGLHLVVEHGKRTLLFDTRNKKKIIDLWFTEADDGTSVRASVTPSLWVADEAMLMPESFRIRWGAFLEEAWAAVDGSSPSNQAFHRAVMEEAPSNLKQGKQLFFIGVIMIMASMLLFSLSVYLQLSYGPEFAQELNFIVVSLLLPGVIVLTYGLMRAKMS